VNASIKAVSSTKFYKFFRWRTAFFGSREIASKAQLQPLRFARIQHTKKTLTSQSDRIGFNALEYGLGTPEVGALK
jgi:hypothetical protein